MKQLWITLLLACVFTTIQAQEIDSGFELSPTISYRISNPSLVPEGQFGMGVGGHLYHDINERFEISTGLKVHYIKFAERDKTLHFGCAFDGNSVNPDLIGIKINNHVLFAGIPIQGRVNILKKTNTPYVKVSLDLWVKAFERKRHIICENVENVEGGHPAIHTILLLSNVGVGYEFQASNQNRFYIEPTFGGSLNTIYDSNIVSEFFQISNGHLLTLGIKMGIIFE